MNEKEEAEKRRERRERAQRVWALEGDLPCTSYDPRRGWKLDEFARFCEPDGFREFKRVCSAKHRRTGLKDPLDPLVPDEFALTIHWRLREPRFRVQGVRPDHYEPEDISLVLLECMFPIIETSELLDTTQWPEPARRRYEHVRVFQTASSKTSRGGRHRTYDFDGLFRKMEAEGQKFPTQAAAKKYCQENVRPFPGKKPSKHGPDLATVSAAIKLYGLDKFIENG